MPAHDLVATAVSVALLAGYHLLLHLRSRRDPSYTMRRTLERVRERWVERVMREGKDILAVQTLRNSTMAATFLASTSVVLIMGILNLVARGDALASPDGPKLLLLLADLFVAFFGFALSIRLYNHVGYMLGVPAANEGGDAAHARVARQLNRAAAYYGAGMRAFYLLVPLAFWFFGPWALVAASLVLCLVLHSNDRAPRDPGARPSELGD